MTNIITREQWLNKLATALEAEFLTEGLIMPKYRISTGFPSKGGLAAKKRTIGQCWSPKASNDQTTEIIISITQDDLMTVAGVLVHEMVHAVVGVEAGHGPIFGKLARACHLEGKLTATTEGEAFKSRVQPLLDMIGAYPHSKLDHTVGQKVQSTRMVKVKCQNDDCGMIFRTSNKWVEIANAEFSCPCCNAPAFAD